MITRCLCDNSKLKQKCFPFQNLTAERSPTVSDHKEFQCFNRKLPSERNKAFKCSNGSSLMHFWAPLLLAPVNVFSANYVEHCSKCFTLNDLHKAISSVGTLLNTGGLYPEAILWSSILTLIPRKCNWFSSKLLSHNENTCNLSGGKRLTPDSLELFNE